MSTKKGTTKKVQATSIIFRVEDIQLLNSSISVPETFQPEIREGLKYKLDATADIRGEEKKVVITIGYVFLKEAHVLFSINTATTFLIKDNFNNATETEEFMQLLVQLSIGHTRGLQSTLIRDTPLCNYYIPPIIGSGVFRTKNNKMPPIKK